MTDEDEDFTPPFPRSRFRWVRKLAMWCLGFTAVLVMVLYVSRWQVGRIGQRQFDATTQRLDAEDPDWRLDAILDARSKNEPAAKDNAAPEVLDLAEQIPMEFRNWQKSEDATQFWRRNPNYQLPPPDAVAAARKVAGPTLLLRTETLRLRHRRAGQFPLTVTADPLATALPHLDMSRQVVALLQFDGYLAPIEKNPNRGVSSARAAIGVARAIGDEPIFVSQLVRMAAGKVAAQTAMQVLAWGEPTDGLAELQAELLTEAEAPWFRIGMRGERGFLDQVFQRLSDGTIPPEHVFNHSETGNTGPQYHALLRAYKALLPGDHAKCLQLCTEYVAASKLPPHEQLAALKAIVIPPGPPEEFRYVITRLLLPACEKIAEAGLRTRADLLAAATCVACERFRLKHGRFPHNLAELTPTFLVAVPLSPFDGKPISYRVLPGRVAVYSFWDNSPMKIDHSHDDFREGDTPGFSVGYRLWNPAQRGLPAPVEEKQDP